MFKIAITGVGGGVGQSIVKALQNTNYLLVKIDAEPLATGLYTTGTSYLGEYVKNEEKYLARIIEICQKEKCAILFPGLDRELPVLAQYKEEIYRQTGTRVIVSDPAVINIADDKLLTADFLKSNGFRAPITVLPAAYKNFVYPGILKMKTEGARSIGTYKVNSIAECEKILQKIDISNYVLQEYIDGDEYTCGSVYSYKLHGVIIMRRILRDGDTYKAFVENDEHLKQYISRVIEVLQPYGACNIQLRKRGNEYFIFEINARCSGTTAARTLAGFNEPLFICNYLLQQEEIKLETNPVCILRYWNELVVQYSTIEELKNKQMINTEGKL
ncbi:MAG: ATP-grasp domain-containing protein [Bacteroidia bacterium]